MDELEYIWGVKDTFLMDKMWVIRELRKSYLQNKYKGMFEDSKIHSNKSF